MHALLAGPVSAALLPRCASLRAARGPTLPRRALTLLEEEGADSTLPPSRQDPADLGDEELRAQFKELQQEAGLPKQTQIYQSHSEK